MHNILEHEVGEFESKRNLYEFFASAHSDWACATSDSLSTSGMQRLWEAELRMGWMTRCMQQKNKLVAMLNKEVIGLRAAHMDGNLPSGNLHLVQVHRARIASHTVAGVLGDPAIAHGRVGHPEGRIR